MATAPSICASTVAGFTTCPQSTAHTTLWTRTRPVGIDRTLGHVGDEAFKRFMHGNATRPAVRQRAAPARPLGGEVEDPSAAGIAGQEAAAEFIGIQPCGVATSSIKLSTTKAV